MTLLLIYVFAPLFCCGVYLIGESPMLLGGIKEWLRIRLDRYMVWKAVWDCPPCMASIWGSLFFWGWHLLWPIEYAAYIWIPSLFVIAVLNGFTWNLYCLIRAHS